MTKSERLASILRAGGIRVKGCAVLGAWAHVDTIEKHRAVVKQLLAAAGFQIVSAENRLHLDGYRGLRISAKLAGV